MVAAALVTAWCLAVWPTSTSPSSLKLTTDGVSREPARPGISRMLFPSHAAATEFVVPRSTPMILAILSPRGEPSPQ